MVRSFSSLLLLGLCISCAMAKEPERWDGTIAFGNLKLPFSMQLRIDGATASATFTNPGDPSGLAGKGSFSADKLRLTFEGATLEGTIDGGSLKGVFATAGGQHKVDAGRFCTCGFQGEAGPDISGAWTLDGGKGKLAIHRKGEDTFAVLTLDSGATTPTLSGRFDGAVFTLAYFNGNPAGAAWLEIEPDKDARVLSLVYQKPGAHPIRFRATR